MNGIPLDAISHKIIAVSPLVVIFAVQMGLKTALKPPSALVMFGAVVIETSVVVSVKCAEWLPVVVFPARR